MRTALNTVGKTPQWPESGGDEGEGFRFKDKKKAPRALHAATASALSRRWRWETYVPR